MTINDNVRQYHLYQAATGFLPWFPLFFLYVNQYVSLGDALTLSAVYYFSVFILEVPSGYMSDRFGRKPTLLVSCAAGALSNLVFLLADGMNELLVAQFLMAMFFALKSGSDNSLLYDSLKESGQTDQYTAQEAKAAKISQLSMALGCLVGGLCGYFDMKLAYLLALMAALYALIVCWRFVEPKQESAALQFVDQLGKTLAYLKIPWLMWLFGFYLLVFALSHVPAEFNQPYIKLLSHGDFFASDSNAMVSGVVMAISMLLGALGATVSVGLENRWGVRRLLLLGLVAQFGIVLLMAFVLHPLILLFVLARNFPMAVTHAPMMNAIAPHIDSAQRATYLSVHSLAGRFSFGILLYGLSRLVQKSGEATELNWAELSLLLKLSALVGVVCLIAMWFSSLRFGSTPSEPARDG